MRVLLAHNFYQSHAPSGEDTVYAEERSLLESRGVEVIAYERHSDELKRAGALRLTRSALEASWSPGASREIAGLIARTRPAVAHFHNTFPLISASAYQACRAARVPVVQTLHNFRLICPGAMLFRDGHPCEDCVEGSLLQSLRHRCYRGSVLATATVAHMIASNRRRGTYARLVSRYIALTRFARDRLIAGGLPGERIAVKPNGLNQPFSIGDGAGGYAVFVGRISEEKGVRVLLQAWRRLPAIRLVVVGEGPLLGELRRDAQAAGLGNVEFRGRLPREQLQTVVGSAALVVMPSLWFEGFPMVALEAFACGTPVVASRLGSLAEIVRDGVNGRLFAAGNASALADVVASAVAQPQSLARMRRAAREEFAQHYSAEANFSQLMSIYESALESDR